jgi:hypothetical protein
MSVTVKLSRIERLLNAAGRVPILPKPDDKYLLQIKEILAEERKEGYNDGRLDEKELHNGWPARRCGKCGGPIKVTPNGYWCHDNSGSWYAGRQMDHDAEPIEEKP